MTALPGPGDGLAEEGAEVIRTRTDLAPEAAVILGSGLGAAAAGLDRVAEVAFTDLPGFPAPSVPGHAGRLALGHLAGVPVAAFLGRVHFYEGHPMSLVTLPTRLARALGARALVATAAVGGLAAGLRPGTLVVGEDHISFMGENPLRGWRDADGRPPFVSPGTAYDAGLRAAALEAAGAIGLPAATGVYAAMAGPTYETPTEIAHLRSSGATVVGMSVVPEASAAAALRMRFLGMYCVTNETGGPVSHREVEDVAAAFSPRLAQVLERVLEKL